MSKERTDPRESLNRVVDALHKFAADGYTVERTVTHYDLERPSKHGAKVEVGITVTVYLTPIA